MHVGIVGHESKKFTVETEAKARAVLRSLLKPGDVMVSGHCHLGGIDIWAEEEAKALGLETLIFPPKTLHWDTGFKPRNLLIAKHSDVVHCIVVARLPGGYRGMKFDSCYHCRTDDHVKSGGCWTAKRAKRAEWHIIREGT